MADLKTHAPNSTEGSMRGKAQKEGRRDTTFAKGGSNKMFGKQAAGPDRPGNVGKDQSAAPGGRFARGGRKMTGASASVPAKGSSTGTRKAR